MREIKVQTLHCRKGFCTTVNRRMKVAYLRANYLHKSRWFLNKKEDKGDVVTVLEDFRRKEGRKNFGKEVLKMLGMGESLHFNKVFRIGKIARL